jgi:ferredoxin
MEEYRDSYQQRLRETEQVKTVVRDLGIDLVGIADLRLLDGMPCGMSLDSASFLTQYPYAIVMGAQIGKLGSEAPGIEVSLFLEKAASKLVSLLVKRGYHALTVHAEDEFHPTKRMGFMSLKVLAKGAGLGWQGRSLLIVSPKYGPIHRLIGVLTNMKLHPDSPIPNQCGDCSICVGKCPTRALTLSAFEDHPETRQDVLDVDSCLGNGGCNICLLACPWQRNQIPDRKRGVDDAELVGHMAIGKN